MQLRLLSSLAALALLACGGDAFNGFDGDAGSDNPPARDAAPADADAGTGASRPFRLASGGVELLVSGPTLGLQITPANLADDADVIEVHQEYYGVPWDTFVAGSAPPAAWTAVMDGIAQNARSLGKPVFLSITMLDGTRTSLAPRAVVENGALAVQQGWAAHCYDFGSAADAASMKLAYLRYVAWMIGEFSPTWLNVAVEVNLFFEQCPAAAPALIDVANAAYDTAKAKQGALVVFPSIQIDHLYGYDPVSCPDTTQRAACFDRAYAAIAPLKRDRFAMSSYPMLSAIDSPSALPADWFTRGAARGGERPLIAETGYLSTPLVADARAAGCETVFHSSEAEAAAYLAFVLAAAQSANMDLVNWWSDRDLVVAQLMTDCPCSFDSTWCAVLDAFRGPASDGGADTQFYGELVLKAFGTMGLRSYDGTGKSALMAAWQAARAAPIVEP